MEITETDISKWLETIEENRKKDILALIKLGRSITQKEPKMWGSILGFGKLHYRYKTGRQGDMPELGIANRKQAITLYMSYDINQFKELKNLGKFKTGQGCLYIKKLEDIDIDILKGLIIKAIKHLKESEFITDIDM